MNDAAVRDYSTWARNELMEGVRARCARYGIAEAEVPARGAEAVDGRALTAAEISERDELLDFVARDGLESLVERAAYTWFDRLVAIRFMEVNDRLPGHVRVLSAPDGSFAPQALSEALDLELAALDSSEVARLVGSGDDEALFRIVFLAFCDTLAETLPAVFEHVGSAMELLLPDGLLRKGGVVERLVDDIPEEDWGSVEIVGWMYQYYVSERKDEAFAGFKKGKKADRRTLAPATQLFTPGWIVDYLAENSLGRLWVLNHPETTLRAQMKYFVDPDAEHESEFLHVESPEEIRVIDPACGSGHILVRAFDLLSAMYAEAGYSKRDAAKLIVEKNLVGLEIDPRAAQLASFCVSMRACELDSRFLRRGVTPNIVTLSRVAFTPEELELCPQVAARSRLLDAAAHFDECGSLFRPEEEDLEAVAGDLASLAGDGSLFAGSARGKLGRLLRGLTPLAGRYSAVVANPPYMGSKNMGAWLSAWVKDEYPDEKGDLCTCFVERGFGLAGPLGYSAMVTMQSWMFLGSYEKMRSKLLHARSVACMAHLGTRAFSAIGGEVVSTTATVFANAKATARGSYVRLVDYDSEGEKRERLSEALADPDGCPWFYRADAADFSAIPGSPIAYWASEAVYRAFDNPLLGNLIPVKKGLDTGDNELFLRVWWEVDYDKTGIGFSSSLAFTQSGSKWAPHDKGGNYRRWYGNNGWVINWQDDGFELKHSKANLRAIDYYFHRAVTWNALSSGACSFRLSCCGAISNTAGSSMYPSIHHEAYLSLMNSSLVQSMLSILAPTLNYSAGPIALLPIKLEAVDSLEANVLGKQCVSLSRADWDSHETSWDFKRHPLI